MGKILHALGRPGAALEHLETALIRAERNQPVDFACELAARCALQLADPDRAARHIDRAAKGRSRPYIHHTQADVLLAQGKPDQALVLLARSAEHDRRSRHKSLIRMGRIHLGHGRPGEAEQCCRRAVEFCRTTFGNPSHEAMFWQAAALYQLNKPEKAAAILAELRAHTFRYPNLNRLTNMVNQALQEQPEQSTLSRVK
jgi:tetratricopeptide (TPR) repeat protein